MTEQDALTKILQLRAASYGALAEVTGPHLSALPDQEERSEELLGEEEEASETPTRSMYTIDAQQSYRLAQDVLQRAQERSTEVIDAVAARRKLIDQLISLDLMIMERLATIDHDQDVRRSVASALGLVDISVDQGGCFEATRPTTHSDPVFIVEGSVLYCVANMPGAVPHTSTRALANATLPYVIELAERGWRRATRDDPALAQGVNIVEGAVTLPAVAEAHGLPLSDLTALW